MKTQNVTPNSTSFGRINFINHTNVGENICKAIESAPAVKRMGDFYDANVSLQNFFTNDFKGQTIGLTFSDIKPKNLFAKIKGAFQKLFISERQPYMYNSNQSNEADFINELAKMDKNTFLRDV